MQIETYQEMKQHEAKEKSAEIYQNAMLISSFVGCVLSGKSIPTYEDIFEKQEQEQIDRNTILIKERLLDFAQEANRRRHNNGNN